MRDDAVLTHNPLNEAGQARAVHRRITELVGGTVLEKIGNPVIDATLVLPFTAHPLGGATLFDVTDGYGRVHGQRGLYVNDGALVPGSTGACNPSLTIAALAERNMEAILAKDLGTVF